MEKKSETKKGIEVALRGNRPRGLASLSSQPNSVGSPAQLSAPLARPNQQAPAQAARAPPHSFPAAHSFLSARWPAFAKGPGPRQGLTSPFPSLPPVNMPFWPRPEQAPCVPLSSFSLCQLGPTRQSHLLLLLESSSRWTLLGGNSIPGTWDSLPYTLNQPLLQGRDLLLCLRFHLHARELLQSTSVAELHLTEEPVIAAAVELSLCCRADELELRPTFATW